MIVGGMTVPLLAWAGKGSCELLHQCFVSHFVLTSIRISPNSLFTLDHDPCGSSVHDANS